MIDREAARVLAERVVREQQLGSGVRVVAAHGEVGRLPSLYLGPDLTRCWIAYVDRPVHGIGPSTVVLIDNETGQTLYAGTANDEG